MLGLVILGGAVYLGTKLVGGAADEAKKTFSSHVEENSSRYSHHELTPEEKALIREYRISKQLDERGMYEID